MSETAASTDAPGTFPEHHIEAVRTVLAEHGRLTSDVATLGIEESLFSAGLTSHATVNVMLALEDAFDVEFPERFLKRATFETIASLCGALGEIAAP